MRLRAFLLFSLPMLFLSAAGCGSNLSTVTGTVTWNNAPVDKATVTLFPDGDKGATAIGYTDATGKFSLDTLGKPGVEPGNYKVVVTKVESFDSKLSDEAKRDPLKAMQEYTKDFKKGTGKGGPPGMPPMAGKAAGKQETHLLPIKYSKKETTDITHTVPGATLTITLTGEAPK